MTKSELLHAIQVADFAVTEANLFLDSHPTDSAALAYFNKYKMILMELSEEYAEKYGPLKAVQNTGTERWRWAYDPFPWTPEANA